MKKITLALLMLSIAVSGSLYAGIHALTHHSRANCGNNESISWHLGHSYWFWVTSFHIKKKEDHQATNSDHWEYTWRAAAVHWGEGTGGWSVQGTHWMKDDYGNPVIAADEYVKNCSIYDGWWDK